MSFSSAGASILKAAAILLIAASAAGCLRGRPRRDVDGGGGTSAEESRDQGGSRDQGQPARGIFEDHGDQDGGYEDDGGDFEDNQDDYYDDGFF